MAHVVRTLARARVLLASTALTIEVLFPTTHGRDRMWFMILVGGVFLPYGIITALTRRRDSLLYRAVTPAIDLLMLFSFDAILPPPNIIPVFANVLVVVYAGAVGGLAVGLAASAAATGLAAAGQSLNPSPDIDAFALIMFGAILVATTLMVQGASREQRLSQTQTARMHVSSLSHELRTPLTSINGFAQLLQAQWHSLDEPTRDTMLSRISANTRELGDMIEQILEFSQTEEGAFQDAPSVIALRDSISTYVEQHRPALGEHPIRIDVRPDALVKADPFALERVLANLLSNAVKYSPGGSEISVHAHPESPASIVVSIRDHGPGIPPDKCARVFDPFYRLQRRDQPGGTGLGLALVRRHVERSGGRVWVDSVPGAGSTFSFTLPSARRPGSQ